jgi:hypothetical protein
MISEKVTLIFGWINSSLKVKKARNKTTILNKMNLIWDPTASAKGAAAV